MKTISLIIFLALLGLQISCKRSPDFVINGVGYYVKTKCVNDSTWRTYGYRYGISYRGKYEWSYGAINNHKCLEMRTDTIKCEP